MNSCIFSKQSKATKFENNPTQKIIHHFILDIISLITEGSRNDVSFRGYQAKGDEKWQGEGGGHKFRKMGRRRLWMAPK